ncbi:MAG: T9SS type A sorting domain-containing protein [Bacteroidales bacterium]|nr:T9SS type A sorting domain-containing protein [Bacteroidales bacterium]
MNKLTFIKRFAFAVLSLLITANLWGQAALSGSGTSANPYQIASVADWNAFAAAVNGGYDYSGKYIQLEADVPSEVEILEGTPALTAMVGVWDETEDNRKPFKGTFRGNGKTIIVSYTSDGNYTAPFRCTNGATITNDFTVVGNINATNGYAAGLVGINYGSKTKINSNVTVRVNLTGGGTYCGGVAVDATYLEMSSCLYNGQIIAGDYSGGFCATGDANTKFNKCIFDPAAGSSITGTHTGNFINGTYNTTNSNNYYYTYEAPTASTTQGDCIYTSYGDIPNDGKFRMLTNLAGNDNYYVEGTCVISGIDSLYYQNNAQHGGITYDVMFNLSGDPATVIDPECYTAAVLNGSGVAVNVSTIAAGTYTLRITGKEGCCSGSVTSESFIVKETIFDHGTGTETNPYEIRSITDWSTFAKAVNDGHSFLGEYLKLTNNITVNVKNLGADTIVGAMTSGGAESKWFSGTFDGDWHTLTFNVGTSGKAITPAHNNSPSAPFRVIDGATIKNLIVDGTIYSKKKYNAGFVGFAYNTKTSKVNNIINCTSNIIIKCKELGSDASAAGFVAENKDGSIKFNNSIFYGSIEKDGNGSAAKCAGFVSFNNGGKLYFTNCTMAGTIDLSNDGTFYRASSAKHEYSNCYYVTKQTASNDQLDATNCKQAYTDATIGGLTNEIYKKYVKNSTNYYIPSADITGFETTTYSYISGQTITITAPVVSYYGRTLKRGTNYVIKVNEVQVDGAITLSAAGDYNIKAKAGSNYGGSKTTTIKVINFNSWAVLKAELADDSKGDRVITLSGNITSPNPKSDSALVVKGNVVLNLNNKTINRNLSDTVIYGQVIRVKKGANLTINGPGTITGGFNWPGSGTIPKETTYYPKRDGGGIHNMGNLVLNNVDVEYNKCYKEVSGSTNPSARGGGIYSGSGSSLIINGGSVSSNIGRGGGGGVFCDKANPFVMTGVEVYYNDADSKGGGLRIKTTGSAIAYLTDCDISWWNSALADASQGGGVYLESGELVMTRCNISGNATTMQGGGFFSYSGKTTAIDCTIENNGTYYYDSDVNHGGGICLFDNKGSNHSIYIMDGGVIKNNNCSNDGGGVYVYEGAVFQVKGNVQITDNVQGELGVGGGGASNAYLVGESVIEVIGPLDEEAIINITPVPGHEGVYVTFDDGATSGDPLEDLSHFVIDSNEEGGDDYGSIIDESGNVVVYGVTEWNDKDTWDGTIATNLSGNLPTSSNDVIINRAVKIPSDYTALAKDITLNTFGSIIIEDGGQLKNNNAVAIKAKKGVVAADEDDKSGWYVISSPVANPSIESATNLITTGSQKYDLYRFNEAAVKPWENYRQAGHTNFDILQTGRGYLYRNANNHTIDIDGTLNVSDVTYNLSCGGSGDFKGFNLIGNPYAENITLLNTTLVDNSGKQIVDGEGNPINLTGFYRLSKDDGSWGTEITSQSTAIAPLEGFLVQVDEARKVKFSKTARAAAKSNGDNIKFTVANDQYEDKTYALFEKGVGLEKIEHMNEDVPMVYISSNGADYAIATFGDEVKQFNLNFEAKTTGMYTLGIKTQGEFSYVHVIDKLAEKDIDMLDDGEYSFIGTPADEPDRFIVRLAYLPDYSDEGDDNFVYQNGDEILVSGKGELQVFDVMGRLVMQKKVNGVESVDGLRTGVYVMRIVGESVKTQKIVIR